MAAGTNWLSFTLSPMEMLRSSSTPSDHNPSQFMSYDQGSSTPHYFLDNYYANNNGCWNSSINPKEGQGATATTMGESFTSFIINPTGTQTQAGAAVAPKLEDFLGDKSCQTETITTQDDSSLTHFYDHHSAAAVVPYFNNDLKAITGFQAFSTNSSSEVDNDTLSVVRAEFGHSIESVRNGTELAFGSNNSDGLSLGVNNVTNSSNNSNSNDNNNNRLSDHQISVEKAIVVCGENDSDCSKKIVDTFGQRTSIYRGVTRHRWTGRYEAHLWDNSCRREGQARKGRQAWSKNSKPKYLTTKLVSHIKAPSLPFCCTKCGSGMPLSWNICELGLTVYLGGYDMEEKAARAYDLAALKYWGPSATTNFPVSNYVKELEEMKFVSKQEFIASLRRKSSGFSRGASIYRGVTRHHQQGRWQARIGRVAGNKDLYLGTFATEEEAAEAYDIAAIKFRGLNAVTNFEMSRYDVEAIMKSALPIGGAGKRLKVSLEADQKPIVALDQQPQCCSSNNSNIESNISFCNMQQQQQQPISTIPCGIPFDATSAFYHHNVFHHFQPAHNFAALEFPGSPSSMSVPIAMVPQTAEFFIWPHHQSY